MYSLNNFFRIHYRYHIAAFYDKIEIFITQRTLGNNDPAGETVESDLLDLIPMNFPFAKKLEVRALDAFFVKLNYRENSCKPKYRRKNEKEEKYENIFRIKLELAHTKNKYRIR